MQWQTYYGTPSTTKPSGATGQNMQCRWYKTTADADKIGYTQMLFDVTKATYVTFDAASTNGIQVKAEYSTDQGATWQNEAIFTLKGTYDVPYKYVISTEGITARVKFSIVLPASAPTDTSRLYLDNVTVYGKEGGHIDIPATITASDIKDIAATGGEFSAANAYEVINSTSNVTATCDGEIVTNAAAAAGTLSYTLAPNYGTEARTGSITLTLADDPTVTKTINVTQKGSVYDVSPASITLGGDSGATAEFTLTSDFEVDAPVVSAPDKFSVSGPVDNVYTVTALADGGAAEAELGTITFTRKGDNGDNKEIVIPVKQTAKGGTLETYTKISSINDLTDGEYIIAASVNQAYIALPASPTISSGKITGAPINVTDNTIQQADATGYVWTITKSGNFFTLSDGTNYLYHATGGNSGTNLDYGTSTSYPWSITYESNAFKFAGVTGNTVKARGLLYQIGTVNKFGGYSLTNYSNSSYSKIYLFKKN